MSLKSVSRRSETRAADAAARESAPQASQAPAAPITFDEERVRELTERLAFEFYESRGSVDGYDREDWLAAEKAVRARLLAGEA